MLIIVRGARNMESTVQSVMFLTLRKKAKLRVKNTTGELVEFIYETTEKALQRVAAKGENISDMLYKAGDIEYVNIVMQNDEVSN